MFIKYKDQTEPGHVFLTSLVITFILEFGFYIFNICLNIATSWSLDFCPGNLVALFLFISRYLDILVMQADRFIAVYFSLHYKGRASTNIAHIGK